MLAVHLAHSTKRIKFGSAFNIPPMWHPLRLAEDFAMADNLTQGRTIFGIGRGYHSREVETFGAPLLDQAANRALFEEQVEIIFKAFNEPSFSHHGEHYTIPPKVPYRGYDLEEISLVPRPLSNPVECWQAIVSGNPRGLDLMMKHGIKGFVGGGAASLEEGPIQAYQDAATRAGRELAPGEGLCLGAAVLYRRHSRAGDSRDHAALRRARQDVRSAQFPSALRRAEGCRLQARRMATGRGPDGRALHR